MMYKILPAALLVALVASGSRGQDNPRALLERAIGAHGGERLLRARTVVRIGKGEIDSFPKPVVFTGQAYLNLPDQARWKFELNQNNQKILVILIVDGDKGWRSAGGAVKDMSKGELEEMQLDNYVAWIATLVPILEKRLELSALPASKVNDQPVAGFKVSSKGKPDVKLYFDKASNLLVKAEYTGRVAGLEARKEFVFTNYKQFQGVKLPHKIQTLANGKRVAEWTVTSYQLPAQIDKELFGKP